MEQPTPPPNVSPNVSPPPQRNKGLIAGLISGIISPDHTRPAIAGGVRFGAGGRRLTSHVLRFVSFRSFRASPFRASRGFLPPKVS